MKILGSNSRWQIKRSQYFNIHLFLKLSDASGLETGELGSPMVWEDSQEAARILHLGEILYEYSCGPPPCPSPIFCCVSHFPSPLSAPAQRLRPGVKHRHPKRAMKQFCSRLVLRKGRTAWDDAQSHGARDRYIAYPHTCTHRNYEYLHCISAWKFHSSHILFSEILHRYKTSSIFLFLERKAGFLCILV